VTDLIFVEDLEVGTLCEWPAPPRVAAALGDLPFAAPSNRGVVVKRDAVRTDLAKLKAFVRFQYKNPTGGQSWSAPIEVLPGQACAVANKDE
jgi:hypothetical protein